MRKQLSASAIQAHRGPPRHLLVLFLGVLAFFVSTSVLSSALRFGGSAFLVLFFPFFSCCMAVFVLLFVIYCFSPEANRLIRIITSIIFAFFSVFASVLFSFLLGSLVNSSKVDSIASLFDALSALSRTRYVVTWVVIGLFAYMFICVAVQFVGECV